MSSSVILHGDEWKISDLEKEIDWARSQNWTRQVWQPSAALVHKRGGTVSLYIGQKFDPDKVDLVSDGWSHDHCSICYWTLHLSDDEDCGVGFKNEGTDWLCLECHTNLVQKKQS